MSKTKTKKPIILCCGASGRALVYGYVDGDPVAGQPVTLRDARMVLRFAVHGLFGLAAKGPAGDTRITHAVPATTETVWQEWIAVTTDAATAIDGWHAYDG